ncbi:sulfotransferase domain-containing protein [Fictibacillus sp. 26RED30]|uniref:sulfotransferase domain-containing protein n=1 Tax=Fictibacillus sp. 26RED30 TaxID=2745877 RepID=UPI0018CE09C9|nr:sulfotransferase domain-containing protein [Fictibacillus sp. 26RED30]MBH0160538.1 sulfotransferase domain-containing protein [Fictibacillus sp. 26RED30]
MNKKTISPFFFNSFPKSGTHLMFQILTGIHSITFDQNLHLYEGVSAQLAEHQRELEKLSDNEFLSGHIYYSASWASLLQDLNMKQIFLYRDLRDVVVSYNYYIEKVNAPLHQYFKKKQLSKKERMLSIIRGIPELGHQDIHDWFSEFKGWLSAPNVLSIKFEDLLRSEDSLDESVQKIVQFVTGEDKENIDHTVIKRAKENISTQDSATFRKGTIGNWKEEFDEEITLAFKGNAGQLLIELGYEPDLLW